MKILNVAFQKIENFLVFTNKLNCNLLFIVKPPQLGRLYIGTYPLYHIVIYLNNLIYNQIKIFSKQ